MKINRRSLGGLFAGGVAAIAGGVKHPPPSNTMLNTESETPMNWGEKLNRPVPASPQEELRHYLKQRSSSFYDHYPRRDRYEDVKTGGGPNVEALKSCSPAGRDMIFRTRWAKIMYEQQMSYLDERIADLRARYPFLDLIT